MSERTTTETALSTADFVAGAQGREPEEEKIIESRGAGTAIAREEPPAPLYHEDQAQELRSRWSNIQAGFVDDPRIAVQQADELVATAMKRLAEVFADERSKLEHQWDHGDNISTEDLRVALQRYRSFFNRLLAV
jgi:hypothetical protein